MAERADQEGSINRQVVKPRDTALSTDLLTRVFHQPSLIYFQVVARHLSIREASRQLNISSSAVTRQIAQLEDALGLNLFHREKRRLKLTSAGEILYRHAQRLTQPIETALSELEMLRGIRTGTVRIATVESVGISFLPELISSFGRKYPRLNIDIASTSAIDVVEQLIDEKIDIGFSFLASRDSRIEVSAQHEVPIGALMAPAHPLAKKEDLTVSDCLALPVAVAKPEISIRQLIQPLIAASDRASAPLVEVTSIRMLVELALGGHYLSIATPLGAQQEIASGALIFRPLADPGLPSNRFAILVRNAGALQFSSAVFYEHAMSHFRQISFPGEN